MTTLLNATRVRARRLELNLSERQLSAITGLGQSVIRSLEAGTNHKDLTLGELTRLAAALASTSRSSSPKIRQPSPLERSNQSRRPRR